MFGGVTDGNSLSRLAVSYSLKFSCGGLVVGRHTSRTTGNTEYLVCNARGPIRFEEQS